MLVDGGSDNNDGSGGSGDTCRYIKLMNALGRRVCLTNASVHTLGRLMTRQRYNGAAAVPVDVLDIAFDSPWQSQWTVLFKMAARIDVTRPVPAPGAVPPPPLTLLVYQRYHPLRCLQRWPARFCAVHDIESYASHAVIATLIYVCALTTSMPSQSTTVLFPFLEYACHELTCLHRRAFHRNGNVLETPLTTHGMYNILAHSFLQQTVRNAYTSAFRRVVNALLFQKRLDALTYMLDVVGPRVDRRIFSNDDDDDDYSDSDSDQNDSDSDDYSDSDSDSDQNNQNDRAATSPFYCAVVRALLKAMPAIDDDAMATCVFGLTRKYRAFSPVK